MATCKMTKEINKRKMMVIRSGGDSFVQLSTCLMLAARRSAVIHINTNKKNLTLACETTNPKASTNRCTASHSEPGQEVPLPCALTSRCPVEPFGGNFQVSTALH